MDYLEAKVVGFEGSRSGLFSNPSKDAAVFYPRLEVANLDPGRYQELQN